MHRWVRTIVVGSAVSFGCLFLVTPAALAVEPRDEMVNVRGSLMHLRIYPGNEKTILLEAGSGKGADAWNGLAPRIAAETGATVISYDRAGAGTSEPLTTSYDIHDEVSRVHAALYKLGRSAWVMLVGHSYGGYMIQLYSNMYPGDVHGLVYVDADTVRSMDAVGATSLVAKSVKAKEGPDATPEDRAALRHIRAFVATHETMRRYPVVCDVPVTVITAEKAWPNAPQAEQEGWAYGHHELARMSGGKLVVAKDAGHSVHFDKPDLVLEEIAETYRKAPQNSARLGTVGKYCA